jgi:hypothetical protein
MTRRIRSFVFFAAFAAFAALSTASVTSALAAGPSITATGSGNGQLNVTGTGFAGFNDSVLVEVYSYNVFVRSINTTATRTVTCFGRFCTYSGGINVTSSVGCSPWGTPYEVIAYDSTRGAWSNWSDASVTCPW